MPRKLKTYITNLGFFELAIAVPSMKAALEAWGMSHNAFQNGFAKQTEDPAIVSATEAMPGVVLKRAVGTSGPFAEHVELPDTLPTIRPPAPAKPGRRVDKTTQSSAKSTARQKPTPDSAAIISFEQARRKRKAGRAKAEAQLAKQSAKRERATNRAQAMLQDAQEADEMAMASLDRERGKLDQRAQKETERWEAQRKKLVAAVERARD